MLVFAIFGMDLSGFLTTTLGSGFVRESLEISKDQVWNMYIGSQNRVEYNYFGCIGSRHHTFGSSTFSKTAFIGEFTVGIEFCNLR